MTPLLTAPSSRPAAKRVGHIATAVPPPRLPMPATVVVGAMAASAFKCIRDSLATRNVAVTAVDGPDEAAGALLASGGVPMVFAIPADGEGSLLEGLLRLRASFPHTPFLAVFLENHSSTDFTMRLGRSGVTQLINIGATCDLQRIRLAISRCHADGVAVRVWRHCDPRVPESLKTLMKKALRCAHAPISLECLANAAGMHERSLRKHCEIANIPSPQWIIGWARLLIAGYYLEEPARTVQSVAELLQFPSAVALANRIRRYTGVGPSRIREHQATVFLVQRLESHIKRFVATRQVALARSTSHR